MFVDLMRLLILIDAMVILSKDNGQIMDALPTVVIQVHHGVTLLHVQGMLIISV